MLLTATVTERHDNLAGGALPEAGGHAVHYAEPSVVPAPQTNDGSDDPGPENVLLQLTNHRGKLL